MSTTNGFTETQKNYLQGFALGADVARKVLGLPVLSGSAAGQSTPMGTSLQLGPQGATIGSSTSSRHARAQDRFLQQGLKLSKEEQAKRDEDPFAIWPRMKQAASDGVFPKGTDVFLWKFHGLFHVAPAEDFFMCRLRIAGGELKSWQLKGIADLSESHGGGYIDVTTRANLQIREIPADRGCAVHEGLVDLGLINKGSGADNIRNVTSSATAGIDPQELFDTLPLARDLHHRILNDRELYGLPRKFNISFDGGGAIPTLEETNDIGFQAVRVSDKQGSTECPTGVYFRLVLGGITGHSDFARDTGVLLKPEECVPVAVAIVRVFIDHGDRTKRERARLKYLLDAWGFEKFISEVERELGSALRRVSPDRYQLPSPPHRWAHVGVHSQRQSGLSYIGVVLPVGRLSCEQARGLAAISERFGSGRLRLTVWQNLILTDIPDANIDIVTRQIEDLGLDWRATSFRSGLVACTGNAGCKYAAADTKTQAQQLAAYLEERIELDTPINIHLTGCPHSCAQHYIGDIGLRGTKVEIGEDLVEGYEVVVGGGFGNQQSIGKQLFPQVAFTEIPPLIERLLGFYLDAREDQESFSHFVNRQTLERLKDVAGSPVQALL